MKEIETFVLTELRDDLVCRLFDTISTFAIENSINLKHTLLKTVPNDNNPGHYKFTLMDMSESFTVIQCAKCKIEFKWYRISLKFCKKCLKDQITSTHLSPAELILNVFEKYNLNKKDCRNIMRDETNTSIEEKLLSGEEQNGNTNC